MNKRLILTLYQLLLFYLRNGSSVGDHTFSQSTRDISSDDWCYNEPTCDEGTWAGPCAFNSRQSPINLPGNLKLFHSPRETVKNFPRSKLVFDEYEIGFSGHAIQIKVGGGKPLTFTTRNLHGSGFVTYTLYGLDFHWGNVDSIGSEHTINRKSFSGEVHLAFYDATKFRPGQLIPKSSNRKKDSTFLVIGAMLDVDTAKRQTKGTSNFLKSMVDKLGKLHSNQTVHVSDKLYLQDLFQGNVAYKYPGSFTAPNCREVEWWFMRKPVLVPLEHLQAFRNAKVNGVHVPGNNFRSLKDKRYGDISLINLQYV